MARTRAHPPRRLAMSRASRRSLKLIAQPAHPLPPEEETSPGVCLRQPGLLGRRTPDHNPPPEEGLMLTRERPYWPRLDVVGFGCLRWFAGLSTPPLPGWLQGAMGGPAVGEARRQPPAIIGSSIPGPLAGDWIQDPPAQGESRMRGSSCITCGHHPQPPGRRLTGNGDPLPETFKTPAYKQGRGRGRGRGRGKGRESGWGKRAQEKSL